MKAPHSIHATIVARYELAMRNIESATTITDVDIHHAAATTCIDLCRSLDFPLHLKGDGMDFHGIHPVSMSDRLGALTEQVQFDLESDDKRRVNLDASTPAALSATLATLREWMREVNVAHVTIMPQDVSSMGVDADTASQRMWDAAERVITEERFEVAIVYKNEADLKVSQWRVISLGNGFPEAEPKHSQGDTFHFAWNKYATADDFIRAHQQDNSPEEWYVIAPAPMAPRGWDVAETDHD